MSDNETRRLLRQVIRQVHPDLFAANPYERQCNQDSLQVLNAYVDALARGLMPSPARLEFFVRDAGMLVKREAELSSGGSLAPLFFSFGLISEEEYRMSDPFSAVSDTNFIQWLQETVQEAVRTAEQHEMLKWKIRKYRDTLQEKFALQAVQVGAEYAVSLTEQERQVEALQVLEQGLSGLYQEGFSFDGLAIQLYHPDMCPMESYAYMDERGEYQIKTSYMKSYVADDGAVHLVADKDTINDQVKTLDLERARMLAFVSDFWLSRVKELTPLVQALLGVKAIWCDTKTEQNSQKFVIWAGYLLEKRDDISAMLAGRKFSFSLIVHSESDGPLINFHTSSPILNVRTDCPPSHLLEFLLSETGEAASEAASEVQSTREKEEALLEKVRQTFGLKCIIKICMHDKVLEGAKRLLDNAAVIKTTVNLEGASVALDDCYEVWDSGFISIPFNFKLHELAPKIKLLQAGKKPSSSGSTAMGYDPQEMMMASADGMPGSSSSAGSSSGGGGSHGNGANSGRAYTAAGPAAASNSSRSGSGSATRATTYAALPLQPRVVQHLRGSGHSGHSAVPPRPLWLRGGSLAVVTRVAPRAAAVRRV